MVQAIEYYFNNSFIIFSEKRSVCFSFFILVEFNKGNKALHIWNFSYPFCKDTDKWRFLICFNNFFFSWLPSISNTSLRIYLIAFENAPFPLPLRIQQIPLTNFICYAQLLPCKDNTKQASFFHWIN